MGDEQDAEVPEPRSQEVEQGNGVVVAGDDDDVASRIGEAPEGVEDERDGVVGSDCPVEQVAGHDDEVDPLVPGDGDDLVEGLLELAPPVDPAQLLADMPVGGVEDPHDRPSPASGRGGFSTNMVENPPHPGRDTGLTTGPRRGRRPERPPPCASPRAGTGT